MSDIICLRCGRRMVDAVAAKEHRCFETAPLSPTDKHAEWDKLCHCRECEAKRNMIADTQKTLDGWLSDTGWLSQKASDEAANASKKPMENVQSINEGSPTDCEDEPKAQSKLQQQLAEASTKKRGQAIVCPKCHGRGYFTSGFLWLKNIKCRNCFGDGKIIEY